jgi:hypothetical protein
MGRRETRLVLWINRRVIHKKRRLFLKNKHSFRTGIIPEIVQTLADNEERDSSYFENTYPPNFPEIVKPHHYRHVTGRKNVKRLLILIHKVIHFIHSMLKKLSTQSA